MSRNFGGANNSRIHRTALKYFPLGEKYSNKTKKWNYKLMSKYDSTPYQALCTDFYELDKPEPPSDEFALYSKYAQEAKGPILEPMCGSGRFLIPLLKKGFDITGFDLSAHMLKLCQEKAEKAKLPLRVSLNSFESFSSPQLFQLIFIPVGSFCLLTQKAHAESALSKTRSLLAEDGKFVFEIDTLNCIDDSQGDWKGKWIDKNDGSTLVLNTLTRFDEKSRIQHSLCRYELWENNQITRTEVEDFRVRLYAPEEMEQILNHNGFKVNDQKASEKNAETVIFECTKK